MKTEICAKTIPQEDAIKIIGEMDHRRTLEDIEVQSASALVALDTATRKRIKGMGSPDE